MPDIHLFLDDVEFSLTDKEATFDWLLDLVRNEKRKINDVNIILTSDENLLKINQDFLKHDYFTDIITFQNEGEEISGEIYISIDRVSENAKSNNISIEEELHRVFAHGLLHMCDYKDKSDEDKLEMRSREDFYLNLRPV